MVNETSEHIGIILKRQRMSVPISLSELAATTGVSASHLGRIERGERFPSARVLKKLAPPLGYEEDDLFTLAGYLTPHLPAISEEGTAYRAQLDPMVARRLAQETPEMQRLVLSILNIMDTMAKDLRSHPGNKHP